MHSQWSEENLEVKQHQPIPFRLYTSAAKTPRQPKVEITEDVKVLLQNPSLAGRAGKGGA
jgi:hypothetical protein